MLINMLKPSVYMCGLMNLLRVLVAMVLLVSVVIYD